MEQMLRMMGIDPVEMRAAAAEFSGIARNANSKIDEIAARCESMALDIAAIRAALEIRGVVPLIEKEGEEK
jgi:hypothetical protein